MKTSVESWPGSRKRTHQAAQRRLHDGFYWLGRNHEANHGETGPMSRTFAILTCPNCFGLNSGGNFGERNLNSLTYAISVRANEFGINSVENTVGEQQMVRATIRKSGVEKQLQPDWHRRHTRV